MIFQDSFPGRKSADSKAMTIPSLTLDEIRDAAHALVGRVKITPVELLHGPEVEQELGVQTQVYLKLELFQLTGTFKARAALLNAIQLSPQQHERGVTAISAGNHAI